MIVYEQNLDKYIITAGSTYLDIDAYACCVAMKELLELQGKKAIAYSQAVCNYSVCPSLVKARQVKTELPVEFQVANACYIIVDVSDPEYIKEGAPLDQVVAVYDHHIGFEDYWQSRIGQNAHIEFIGAAATLIYREWKKAGLESKMCGETAKLLIAAILDNTLNLTSSNTTIEDIEAFRVLCEFTDVDEAWCASYFSQVQLGIEDDLKWALLKDIKTILANEYLPPAFAQLCVWDSERILERLVDIRKWMQEESKWLLNIIDIHRQHSVFVCDDNVYQKKLEVLFDIRFANGVAELPVAFLRKQILRKTYEEGYKNND